MTGTGQRRPWPPGPVPALMAEPTPRRGMALPGPFPQAKLSGKPDG
jgi:hypothetical protein